MIPSRLCPSDPGGGGHAPGSGPRTAFWRPPMATRLLARQSLRPRTRQPGNPYPRIRRDTGSDNGNSVVQEFWGFSSRGGLLRCVGKEHPMATHLLRILLFTLTAILIWPSPAPAQRPAVLVNPHVQGNGTAKTIQEGIGMVDPGGKVMVLPGTYNEAIVIDNGLTPEAAGGERDPGNPPPP